MKTLWEKKFCRSKRAMILCAILLCCASACSLDKLYYANAPDPVGAITETFGAPVWVELQPDGSEKLVYLIHDPMGWNYYRRYFILKDGKVTAGGIE